MKYGYQHDLVRAKSIKENRLAVMMVCGGGMGGCWGGKTCVCRGGGGCGAGGTAAQVCGIQRSYFFAGSAD